MHEVGHYPVGKLGAVVNEDRATDSIILGMYFRAIMFFSMNTNALFTPFFVYHWPVNNIETGH